MKRAIVFVVLLGLVAASFVWIAERPGHFSITWLDWQVEAPIGVMFAALGVIAVVAIMLYILAAWLIALPEQLARWRETRRRRRGYEALTRGMVAVAAGDPGEARRQARRANVLLDEPPLTLLLSAQAAQLSDDEIGARRHFNAMLERPETEFLGLRGLLTQALRNGNESEALTLARRARALQPQAPWVLTTLFDLEARAGDWPGAIATVRRAAKLGVLPPAKARRSEAAALIERARAAHARGHKHEALAHARQAHAIDPLHPAAAATLAQMLIEAGRPRKAARLIEQEWPRQQHPELVALYRRAFAASDPVEWSMRVESLAKLAPEARESKIALAQAAVDAKLWGEARRHLAAAMGLAPPSAGLARLMARIEASEKNDAAAERRWLAEAAEAAPDPAWVCDACGFAHRAWQATCGRCRSFDQLVWRSPDRVQPILGPADPAGAIAPGQPAPANLPVAIAAPLPATPQER
jgi:HemY protein